MSRSEHSASRLRALIELSAGGIIIVERRDFVRGCLTCWIERFCRYHATAAMGDVELMQIATPLPRCVAAVIGMSDSGRDDWLRRQVGALRSAHPGLPIMLIVDTEQLDKVEELASQLDLQGFIPPFSSPEVAAAAVHLVVAGGRYFPHYRPDDRWPGGDSPPTVAASAKSLTARQREVLGLLGSGIPNRVIAMQLRISLSTVKVHVHHIIRKLQVGNRTEVALLAKKVVYTADAAVTGTRRAQDTC